MIVQYFSSMGQSGGPSTSWNKIEDCPQCFQYFSVHYCCSRNIVCSVLVKALVLMTIDMKQTDCSNNDQFFQCCKKGIFFHPPFKILVIDASDIINVEDLLLFINICGGQHFTERPINIHLPFTFLKINHAAQCKTAMSCTSMTAYSSDIAPIVSIICIILCEKLTASRCLKLQMSWLVQANVGTSIFSESIGSNIGANWLQYRYYLIS